MYKRPKRHEAVENIQHAQQRAVQVNIFFSNAARLLYTQGLDVKNVPTAAAYTT